MVRSVIYFLLLSLIVISCKVTEYPASGNYAYDTVVKLKGDYPPKEAEFLLEKLKIQIDDSLRYNKVSKKTKGGLGFIKHGVKVFHNFDSSNISRTIDFFKAAYVANGYFRGGVTTYDTATQPKTNGRGKIITFYAQPFKNHFMDSIDYSIYDTAINKLVASTWNQSFLKKKDLYAQDKIEQELRRITYQLKNQGYLFFQQNDLKVIADTINTALLGTGDPFADIQALNDAAEFDKNPNTDITISLRDNIDRKKLKQYYIGKLHIHTDNYDKDLKAENIKPLHNGQILKYFTEDKFTDSLITKHVFMKYGSVYNLVETEKTVEAFNFLNIWQQINIEPIETSIRNDTIDFAMYMQPYQRFQSEVKLEGTYNLAASTPLYTGPNNLFGFNVYLNVKNRNFKRKGIQTNLTANTSADFGKPPGQSTGQNIFNTIQFGLNGNLLFPELKILTSLNTKKKIIQPKAAINANVSYNERLNYFRLFEMSTGYGSKFKLATKENLWDVQLNLNLENRLLTTLPTLEDQIARNPSLRNIYRDGLIAGVSGTISTNKTKREDPDKRTSTKVSKRLFIDGSGIPVSKERLFSFVKVEYDYRVFYKRPKGNVIALRGFSGVGHAFRQHLEQNQRLPFFKQFLGGGPNSLRAWTVRSINSYSTRLSKDSAENFGDVQVELNAEYRHKLAKIAGIPIQGAGFIDMGNIWNWKPLDPTVYPPGKTKAGIILQDIAMAAGYGVRIDFDYFLIRFDFAFKLKEPNNIDGRGGFFKEENRDQFKDIKFQLGINMPF